MASITFDVQAYTVFLGPALGFSTLPIEYPAMILCWSSLKATSKEIRCTFRFIDSDDLPESVYNPETKVANVFVHASCYPWYIDLLRHERPIQCTIDTNTPKWSRLVTGREPVGEGELVFEP